MWGAIWTGAIGVLAVHSWRFDSPISSLRDWGSLCSGGWAFSVVLFVIACLVRDVPLSEAIHLPAALWIDTNSYWSDRPFWAAVFAGPGLTILATASLVRTSVLTLSNAPVSAQNTSSYRAPLWQEQETPLSWSSFWFYILILPLFALVLGHGTWIIFTLLDGKWMMGLLQLCIWIPATTLGILVLHRAELVRYQLSLFVTTVFLVAIVVLHIL